MDTTDQYQSISHEQYHEVTVELLQKIESAQPVIVSLMAQLDTYVGVLVVYSSVMSTILSIASLLILYKLYKMGD